MISEGRQGALLLLCILPTTALRIDKQRSYYMLSRRLSSKWRHDQQYLREMIRHARASAASSNMEQQRGCKIVSRIWGSGVHGNTHSSEQLVASTLPQELETRTQSNMHPAYAARHLLDAQPELEQLHACLRVWATCFSQLHILFIMLLQGCDRCYKSQCRQCWCSCCRMLRSCCAGDTTVAGGAACPSDVADRARRAGQLALHHLGARAQQ